MANHIGNDDYRGWLNYRAQNGDKTAGVLLKYVGNDGRASDYRPIDIYTNIELNHAPLKTFGMSGEQIAQGYYDAWNKTRQNGNNANNAGGQGSAESGSYNTTGSGNSNYNQSAINYYDSAINQYKHQLGLLDGSLGEANKATESQYNTRKNELQGAYDRAKASYNNSSADNRNNLLTNKNTIADRANRGVRGLLRILGANGAGESSAALYSTPEMVAAQAAEEAAGVNSTYRQNQRNLDENFANYQSDYDDDRKQLDDWRAGALRGNEQNMLNQRKSLLGQLAEAYAGRGEAGRADYNAIRDITDQMNAVNTRISELNRFVNPSYTGVKSVYQAPSLSSYKTGNRTINFETNNVAKAGRDGNIKPTLAMLLGIEREREE